MTGLAGLATIITGAGRGLGREHALHLSQYGAGVVVNDVDASAADEVVAQIRAAGGEAVANSDSVATFAGAEAVVDAAIRAFGDLNVVVNNAGFLRDRMLATMTEEEFDSVIAVHLKGTFAISHFAAAHWRAQDKAGAGVTGHRAIVNTSSGSGLHGSAGQTNYAAAKAGVAVMTITHAQELERYGVRVNGIAPVARTRLTTETPGIGDAMAAPVFDPENVAPLVAYLAGPTCRFTGQIFSIFGGVVGLYQGWTVADTVVTDRAWTLEELEARMLELPERIATVHQMQLLTSPAT